jgi:hypothetical protein
VKSGRRHARKPTAIGLAAITPFVMSDAARADLIERTRAASDEARGHGLGGWPPKKTSPTRLAELQRDRHAERDRALSIVRELAPPDPASAPAPQFPSGSTCAVCGEPAIGDLNREPLGKRGGLVNVCSACADGPIVERDHLFGGARAGGAEGTRRAGVGRIR